MLLQDSIHTEAIPAPELPDLTEHISSKPMTPYQVLRLLPKDATPAQQDSAIQAWFQPGEVHYSNQPDTLHLPGHGIGRSLKDVNLPQYYRENFFSGSAMYHPEVDGGRYGMAGDPIPYSLRYDNVITSLLLICFIMTMIAYSITKKLIIRQAKDFFNVAKANQDLSETSIEIRMQLFYVAQTSLLLALMYFIYAKANIASTFILNDEYMLVAIFFGVIFAYYIIKYFIYTFVNYVFFDNKRNGHFLHSHLFIDSCEGILLFPITALMIFFEVSSISVTYFTIFVLVLVKILTFYRCYIIFFRQNALYLQIILYFCTLEIVPLIALWGGLSVIANALKTIF